MAVRKLTADDLQVVSDLCLDAFTESVAPSLSEQGIATFSSIAQAKSFASRMTADNMMLVYEESGRIKGIIELKEGRHIAMLFIAPDCQQQGIGKALVTAIMDYVREDVVTVSASLTSVNAYLRYGFEISAQIAESAGLVYQPMQKILRAS